MAEYQEVVKQFNRMCESYGASCDRCPVNEQRGIFHCWRWITEEPEVAEELIMNWAKENPPVTNAEKFKEVFGFDPLTDKHLMCGTPVIAWFGKEYKEPNNE